MLEEVILPVLLCLILIVGGLLIMMGCLRRSNRCSTISAWKIRFPRLICCG